jgi:hypothetical protein
MMVQGNRFDESFDSERDAQVFRDLLEMLKVGRLPANQHKKQISLAKSWCDVIDDKKDEDLDKGTIANYMMPINRFGHLLKSNVMDIPSDEIIDIDGVAEALDCLGDDV